MGHVPRGLAASLGRLPVVDRDDHASCHPLPPVAEVAALADPAVDVPATAIPVAQRRRRARRRRRRRRPAHRRCRPRRRRCHRPTRRRRRRRRPARRRSARRLPRRRRFRRPACRRPRPRRRPRRSIRRFRRYRRCPRRPARHRRPRPRAQTRSPTTSARAQGRQVQEARGVEEVPGHLRGALLQGQGEEGKQEGLPQVQEAQEMQRQGGLHRQGDQEEVSAGLPCRSCLRSPPSACVINMETV